MWRTAVLTTAVLLSLQSVWGQTSSLPQSGPSMGGGSRFPEAAAPPYADNVRGPIADPTAGSGMPSVPAFTPPPHYVAPLRLDNSPSLSRTPVQPPGPESTITFDTDQVELQWSQRENRWQLFAGAVFLKDFGRSDTEGREVLRLIRELRLNSLGTVGVPRPIMEYWLVNGEPPRGPVNGLRTLPLDTATLRVEQVQGHWCLRDNQRILFNFGQQAEAARRALAVLQLHGFTHVGYVGQVVPVMLVFLVETPSSGLAQASATTPAANTPKSLFSDLHFPRLFGSSSPQNPPPGSTGAPPGPMPTVPATPLGPNGQRPSGAIAPVSLSVPRIGTGNNGYPALGSIGDRMAFDPRQVQVRHDRDWTVALGNYVLASFGPSEGDARLAQAALRYYHCTEQVQVGRPRPVCSFFLANGQAPHGMMAGLNFLPFRSENIQVRQLGSSYVLYDGSQVVLSFGERLYEAEQMQQAIQHYHFDHLCRIGHGDRAMLFFVSTS